MLITVFAGNVPTSITCGVETAGALVTNGGPSTVYYSRSQSASDTVNDGNLTADQSITLFGEYFLYVARSESRAAVNIVADTASSGTLNSVTTTTQTLQSSLQLAESKKLTLTANTPAGGISRLIEFHMTTTFDRPWISWFDEDNRHRAAFGYHTTDASEGGVHQAVELKTVASATGPNAADMRTRFSIGTNAQRVLTGLNFSTGVEINQGEVPVDDTGTPIVEQFGLTLRGYKRDGSASGIVGQFVIETETTDAVTAFLDVVPLDTTKPGQLVLMKSQNTSSGSSGIYIKKGDGTNTDIFSFLNRTGVIRLFDAFTIPSANVTGAGQLYVNAGALVFRSKNGTITTIAAA